MAGEEEQGGEKGGRPKQGKLGERGLPRKGTQVTAKKRGNVEVVKEKRHEGVEGQKKGLRDRCGWREDEAGKGRAVESPGQMRRVGLEEVTEEKQRRTSRGAWVKE